LQDTKVCPWNTGLLNKNTSIFIRYFKLKFQEQSL